MEVSKLVECLNIAAEELNKDPELTKIMDNYREAVVNYIICYICEILANAIKEGDFINDDTRFS